MIANVCIHVENEQPLLCDLYDLPTSADAGLVCTNVRSMDGKRPIFIDQGTSTFFFPYHVIRFLEIPAREMERYAAQGPRPAPGRMHVAPDGGYDAAGDGATGPVDTAPESLLPVAVATADEPAEDELELEIDEGFLQRIRDI